MFNVLEKLEEMTKQNPIQVVVSAIENASPREEVITIERSGAKYAQAVDISPLRRLDLVIRYICQGAAQKAFKSKKSLENALIDEIMDCYNKAGKFVAMTKKIEIEKMAASTK